MNFNEIQELIKLVNKSSLTEFRLKDKDFEVVIRTDKFQKGGIQHAVTAPIAMPSMHAVPPPAPVQAPAARVEESPKPAGGESEKGKNVLEIKSPMVGTFYRSPGPDKPVFVKVGDKINAGDKVCIIEAMKLFNEIESDVTGTVIKVMVEDASPVEYDQVLFLVEM